MQKHCATVGASPQSGIFDKKQRQNSDDFSFGQLLKEMGSLRANYTNKQNPSLDYTTLQFADCKTIPNDTQFIIEDTEFDISLESGSQIISNSTLHANNLSDIDEQNSPEKQQKKQIQVYETKRPQMKPSHFQQKKPSYQIGKQQNMESSNQQQQQQQKPPVTKLRLQQVKLEYYQKPKLPQTQTQQILEEQPQDSQIVKLEKGQNDLLKEIRLQKHKLEQLNKEYCMGETLLSKFKDQQDLRKSQQSNDLTSRSDCSTGTSQQKANRRSSALVKPVTQKHVLTDSDTSTNDEDSNKNQLLLQQQLMMGQRVERKGKSHTMIVTQSNNANNRYQRRQSHNFSQKLGHSKMTTYFESKK